LSRVLFLGDFALQRRLTVVHLIAALVLVTVFFAVLFLRIEIGTIFINLLLSLQSFGLLWSFLNIIELQSDQVLSQLDLGKVRLILLLAHSEGHRLFQTQQGQFF